MFRKVKSWMKTKNVRQIAENKSGNAKKILIPSTDGYFIPAAISDLLQHERRQQWLRILWENSALPKERFERYFLSPLHGVVGLCQRLPASAQGKFAYTDGLVDYVLQTTVFAVRLSKGYMLPRGASAEEQSAQSVSWSAVVYYAALFHSLGRLWNIEGELRSGTVWLPGLSVPEEPYRFRFKAEPDIAGAQVYGEMIALKSLPEPVLQWLGKNPDILRTLLAFISGRYSDATDITDIVNEAIVHAGGMPVGVSPAQEVQTSELTATHSPAATVAPALMQDSATTPSAAPVNVDGGQETAALLSSLDYDLKSEEGEGRPSAETAPDVLQVMSILSGLTNSYAQLPEHEGGNTEPDMVSGESFPEAAVALETSAPEGVINNTESKESTGSSTGDVSSLSSSELGDLFWSWLRDGLREGDISVNTADACVHLTCGFVFISVPGVFFLFLKSHSRSCSSGLKESGRKEQVQAAFEKMRKHRVSDSRRFWQCCLYEEPGCRGRYKKLTGYLIKMSEIYAAGNFPSDSLFLKVIN
ncbi:TraI domain-containing protein [Citrobacter braakii]|uniref:TraI domain-containing protein n=1 Tax=Citrobacter portucalensis TaxID=1639133 RepID=UPI0019001510|nr:TraI domain-containing protein [Citrobacter braakii]MBJ8903796.1 TraI domain-containing protein [Citrobacter braakii]MBJ8907518.1 TraI domain-containing protein [Citrobacter braakii]MBJ8922266.1 TraI domain-containing protein [Citrobacter braakii]